MMMKRGRMSNPWSLERQLGWVKGKMPEVGNRKHPTMKELKGLLNYEADRMHHNASLLGTPFDSYGKKIDERFSDSLGFYVEDILCPSLSHEISEKYGVILTFCQYGRGGATIAPSEWVVEWQGGYGGLDADSAMNDVDPTWEWEENNLAKYNALRRVLIILEFINDFWMDQVADCPSWWKAQAEGMVEAG
jgi:hypothetical protein